MPTIVGVRFRPVTKVYYFSPGPLTEIEVDDRVIVETTRGVEMGIVALPIQQVPSQEVKGKLKRVIRKATPVDLVQAVKYQAQEAEALEKCQELVKKKGLALKVIQAEYSFDGNRLVYSFMAEQRVDFRALVKELGSHFKTRVEMKQVGARDETKILDGYGRCGRRLCCASWLTEFHSVSIKMAKRQRLPLAPSEISGLCGRLLCCLAYEDEMYSQLREQLPCVGCKVRTGQNIEGVVCQVNLIKETVVLEMEESDSQLEVDADEVEVLEKAPPNRRKKRGRRKN